MEPRSIYWCQLAWIQHLRIRNVLEVDDLKVDEE